MKIIEYFNGVDSDIKYYNIIFVIFTIAVEL